MKKFFVLKNKVTSCMHRPLLWNKQYSANTYTCAHRNETKTRKGEAPTVLAFILTMRTRYTAAND